MEKLNLGNQRAAAEPARRPQTAPTPGKTTASESLPSMSGNESFNRSVADATRYLELLASAQKLGDRTTMAIAASEVRVALSHASGAVAAANATARPAMQATLDALSARSSPLLENAPEEVHEERESEPKASEDKESESGEHKVLERLSQFAHVGHVAHEVAEEVVEYGEMYDEAKGLLRFDAYLKAALKHSIRQLSGMRKQVAQRPMSKLVEKLNDADQELGRLAAAYRELHAEVPAAYKALQQLKGSRVVKSLYRASQALAVGPGGAIAKKLGKVISNNSVGSFLGAMAIATDTVKQYVESPSSGGFKVADAVLGGVSTAVFMRLPVPLTLVDASLDVAAPKWAPSAEIHGTVHALTAIAEAAIEKDDSPLERFHERSMKGEYSGPLQLASKAGEAIAQFLAERHFFQND